MVSASSLTAMARAVKSLPQCLCAWPDTPSNAADILPVVTDMFIQCKNVRSLAVKGKIVWAGEFTDREENVSGDQG